MQIELPYGGECARFDLPLPAENVTLLKGPDPSPAHPLGDIITSALADPIGHERLSDIVTSGDSVAVIFDDFTRPTPVSEIMPYILTELRDGGVSDDDVLLVCANGMHAPDYMGRELLVEKLGQETFERYEVISHDAYDYAGHEFVGVTQGLGTPLWINRRVALADVKVAVGTIRPHLEVGYSGGAKMIMPGVSYVWSIIHNHSGSAPRPGTLTNPLRADIDECGQMAGLDFILNVVCNSRNEIVRAFAGDQLLAHRRGVEFGDGEVWGADLSEKADILIMSPGLRGEGYFKSALACAALAHNYLKEDGTILIVASCHRGWAEPELIESGWTTNREILESEYTELLRMVASRSWQEPRRQFQALVYWVQCVVRTCMEKNVILAGAQGFRSEELVGIGLEVNEDIEEAIAATVSRYGAAARAIVIPDLFTLPMLRVKEV
jgi:nickel-dependent lactate racemase